MADDDVIARWNVLCQLVKSNLCSSDNLLWGSFEIQDFLGSRYALLNWSGLDGF